MSKNRLLIAGFLFVSIISSCSKDLIHSTIPLNDESFKISSNLSNYRVTAFSEDSYGHIWIGTDRGLNRYNGKEYYQYFRTDQENSIVNNTITKFFSDSKGRHWNINYGGACYYDSDDTFQRVVMNVEMKGSIDMTETKNGSLIILTQMAQIMKYEESSFEFNPIIMDEPTPTGIAIYPSVNDCIWYVAQNELLHIDVSTQRIIQRLEYPDDFRATSCVLNDNGHILIYSSKDALCFNKTEQIFHESPVWLRNIKSKVDELEIIYIGNKMNIVVTDEGTWFYEKMSGHLFHEKDPGVPYIMPHIKPSVVYIDTNDNLWVGSAGKGYTMIPASGLLFNHNYHQISFFDERNITAIDRDADDGIWAIGDRSLCYSSKDGYGFEMNLADLGIDEDSDVFLSCNRFFNSIWVASGSHMVCLTFSMEKGIEVKDRFTIEERRIRKIKSTDNGLVWMVLGNGGLYCIEERESGKSEIREKARMEGSYGLIYDVLPLKDGRIALSMFRSPIIIFDPVSGQIQEIDYRDNIGEKFHLIKLSEDIKGRIWFGTRDFGLYRMEEGECILIRDIASQAISSMEQDRFGNIWVSTGSGISRYNIQNDHITNFTSINDIGNHQFNRGCSCVMSDGVPVFGTSNGIVSCHNIEIDTDKRYNIVFQNLKINNEYVYPSSDGIMNSVIFSNPQIKLRYDQNNISISFALLDYRPYHTANYRFKLEGHDETWTEIGNDNIIYFSHLRPGRYTLKVDARTLDIDSVEGAELDIRVYNPWWKSIIARILYSILFVLLVCIIVIMVRNRVRSTIELEQTRKNYEHEKMLHKMSHNLFGNTAHDFRSPLTMIAGPVAQFASDPNRSDRDRHLISTMQVGIDRMNRLVNQILDFNKMDSGALKLKLRRNYDLTAKLKEILETSLIYAEYRNVSVNVSGMEEHYILSLDPDKFDSMISNLVSNALKFVKAVDGRISIDLYEAASEEVALRTVVREDDTVEKFICIVVENNGLPISPEDMGKVFDRYYQIKRHGENIRRVGSGIGLSFTKALAELHHGYLWTENMEEEEGVRFTLALPMDENIYTSDEYDDEETEEMKEESVHVSHELSRSENSTSGPEETVMVVDDDIDIANYMALMLESRYKVICCYDAEKALGLIKGGTVPDIILSDIMMSGMDGIELCSRIKSKASTCRIPVILITAKTDLDTRVEGLEFGADAYITKPFEPSLLLAQISSLLKNRMLSKGSEYELPDILSVDISEMSESDRTFVKRLVEIMKGNLADQNFDISFICNELKISRSKMFYKIKDIFGISPNELLKRYRMEVALKLLTEGKYNVSEVAYHVGFSSLSYFSKAFKQQYGKLPKDVKGS